MLRAVVLAVAMPTLAVACALVTAPPPPGTRMVAARVRNTSTVPVELGVKTPTGVLPGAVQPTTLAAQGVADVVFYLPIGDDWWITVNGVDMFPGSDVNTYLPQGCRLGMEVNPDGSGSLGCFTPQ